MFKKSVNLSKTQKMETEEEVADQKSDFEETSFLFKFHHFCSLEIVVKRAETCFRFSLSIKLMNGSSLLQIVQNCRNAKGEEMPCECLPFCLTETIKIVVNIN